MAKMTRGEQTRTTILKNANRLFLQQGYHGTSMRQIAQEAGVAVGSIYNHFEGKEDIFQAVIETYHPYHEILPIIMNAQGESVEDFVRSAAEGLVRALDRRPNFLNLMLIEIVEFDSKHIPVLFSRFFPEVLRLVRRFAEKQENLRDIPLPMVVRTFLGVFFSYYLLEKFMGEYLPIEMRENALGHAMDIFLHGVLSES